MRYELCRWDPLREALLTQGDINWMLSDFWGKRFGQLQDRGFWAPLVDVEETRDEVVVRAEIPGLKKEEIRLQVQGDVLVLTGERRSELESKEKTVHLVERAYGKFQRAIQLPAKVDGSRAGAAYEAGVLAIRLPKQEEAKPKEIAIDVR